MPTRLKFLDRGGETAALVATMDWAGTPLGSPRTWSPVLKATLGIMFRSPQPMFLWWGPERIQLYNDAFIPVFATGKHPAAMGQRAREAFPERWPLIAPKLEAVDRGESIWVENQRSVVRRNGEEHESYWSYGYSPVVGEDGLVAGALLVATEVTREVESRRALERAHAEAEAARKQAEALLEASHALAEAIPQQVWTARPDGALDFVTKRVAEYFGKSAEEILGSGWQTVIHPDDLPATAARWGAALASGELYETEFRLLRADGSHRWHLGRAVPVRDADGAIVRWFGSNTDIHEERRARERLAERAAFEQHLIGIVSHDLRDPLHAISVGVDLLSRQVAADGPEARIVDRLRGAVARGERMVRDLLDFTQARVSGGIPIQPAPANVHAIALHAADEVRARHRERVIALHTAGDGDGVWDADRIEQLLANLLGNAVHHGAADAPIRLETLVDGDSVTLSVWNTGEPIPEALLPVLFEPMTRASPTANRASRSVGLGLFIVKQIATAHGGSVAVRSSREDGTAFTVRLPRVAVRGVQP